MTGVPEWMVGVFAGVLATILLLLALVIVVRMWSGTINLAYLIAEEDGAASLSRFQFLVFTFVIAFGYFLLVLKAVGAAPPSGAAFALPTVPDGVWALLGISGGSFAVSKGIQKSWETNKAQSEAGLPPALGPEQPPATQPDAAGRG